MQRDEFIADAAVVVGTYRKQGALGGYLWRRAAAWWPRPEGSLLDARRA